MLGRLLTCAHRRPAWPPSWCARQPLLQGQLRAQLLAQLSKQRVVNLSAAGAGAAGVSLKRRALNSLLVEYLAAAPYQFTLSVFSEESGTGPSPPLSEAEVLEVLRVEPASLLHQAFVRAKHQHQQQQGVLRALPQQQAQGAAAVGPACVLLSLLDALAEVGRATRGLESGTQTAGDHRYNLEVRAQGPHRHTPPLRAPPPVGQAGAHALVFSCALALCALSPPRVAAAQDAAARV